MRNPFVRFARFYNHLLNKHKYPTQIVTGGILWFSGDILCQTLVHLSAPPNIIDRVNPLKSEGSSSLLSQLENLQIDWDRVGRMTVYGLFISAPVYGFWYTFLDKWSHRIFGAKHLPNVVASTVAASISNASGPAPIKSRFRMSPAVLRTWKIIGFKLFADCALFDPLYLSLFFTSTGLMEGKTLVEIREKLKNDLGKTYLIDVAVWFPIQTVNFRWVPVPYQPIVVQSCNIGWNAYLSFVQHDH
jgi:hypothetical protein